MSSESKPMKIKDINVDKIIFTKLDDNSRIESQKLSYIRYKANNSETQLKIQTCDFCHETYGIPREDQYHPTAKSRAYYKLGFCHDRKAQKDIKYDAIEELYNLLLKLDERCASDDFKKEIFGTKWNDYNYQPLIRIPDEDEENLDKNGKPKYRPPFTKLRLDLEWSSDPNNQSTKPAFLIFEKKDNKRTQLHLNNFDEVVDNIPFLSKLKFIISFSKLYAMKTKMGAKKNYGITLKATHIEVSKPINSKSSKSNGNSDIFSDSESESETKKTPMISRNISKVNFDENIIKKNEVEEVEEDEEVDEEVDEVEEVDEEVEEDEEIEEEKHEIIETPTKKVRERKSKK
jgi:hypothetical protein